MNSLATTLWDSVLPIVTTLLVTIAIPALTAGAWRWLAKLGVDIDARHRDALQTALQNAAGLILAKVAGPAVPGVAGAGARAIPQEAIEYVKQAAPDAIKHFDLGENSIATKIKAKLPQVVAAAAKPGLM